MKQLISAITITAATIASIYFYPSISGQAIPTPKIKQNPVESVIAPRNYEQHNQLEVAFVLDTTGSMSGLIQGAKDNIWSIASSMASAESAPTIKMGLVAYRDRGDSYVTKVSDLNEDLDTNYGELMQYQAGGGGDAPESVNKALYDAVTKLSWSQSKDIYKVIFLVGDAPPKMNYQDEMQYPEIIELAKRKGIIINTIQCGNQRGTAKPWKDIASLSQGNYFQVEQSGGAVAMSTPFDEKIALLATELDNTRLFYGSEKVRQEKKRKTVAANRFNSSAPVSSVARKAEFNVSASGKRNFSGDNELITDIGSGKVSLEEVAVADLPEEVRSLDASERQAAIEQKAQQREKLKKQITELSKQRSDYIKNELAANEKDKDSLDNLIYKTVKVQALEKGLKYESESAKY